MIHPETITEFVLYFILVIAPTGVAVFFGLMYLPMKYIRKYLNYRHYRKSINKE